jgi:hypothetical protein
MRDARSYSVETVGCHAQTEAIPSMNGVERQRLLSALILVAMARFVASGAPGGARRRRPMRRAAITGFLIAVALALAEIVVWWIGSGNKWRRQDGSGLSNGAPATTIVGRRTSRTF